MNLRCLFPFLLLVVSSLLGAEPVFRRHAINPESEVAACAAVDVNRDGKPDIVCGGSWYEAPTWKRHFVRDVERIGNRLDDYSNLPLDVNGDGWTDIVSVNYRSKSLFWVQHPGPQLGPWKKVVIDTPGPMETGRLVDVDGDGNLDVLPNGVQFAAWWELLREKQPSGEVVVKWQRHDLPTEIAGHGLGFGDLNGDGRADLVGPRGWLEAPVDRRRDRWIWHPDFELDRDCSIPILVQDVDQDGDADLIWARAHRLGLYWLEQTRDANGARQWTRHAIDTSWSQSHSLLWADLNGNGRPELIGGKRYLAHDGKDPGEYDPLAAFAYEFDKARRTWSRTAISVDGQAGFGIDPKAVDLDGDGDIDLLAADRNGLFWFENVTGDTKAKPPVLTNPTYASHQDITTYLDDAGQSHPIAGPADWARRRTHILLGMETVMGPLPGPELRVPLDVRFESPIETETYTRRRLTYTADGTERIPAYLLVPKNRSGKSPAMLCLHQTVGIGKDEPAGLGGSKNLHYAHELASRGYVCLVPDYPSLGEYKVDFRESYKTWASTSMKAIWNNIRAVDLLETLPEVDRDGIGCIGHSLGGHNSLYTAAFDQRLRAVVTSCGFTPFHDYYGGKLAGWSGDRYMPRIRDVYGLDPNRMPFDFYEVLGAISPRAIFVNAPVGDGNFDIQGVKKNERAVAPLFDLLGAKSRLRFEYPEAGHDFPEKVREAAYTFLGEVLK